MRNRLVTLTIGLSMAAGLAPELSAQCQKDRLYAGDGAFDDDFGEGVAIHGDTVIAGAPRDDDAGDATGAAYVFERGPGGWVETQKLLASDASSGAWFGNRVSIDGDLACVGARGDDTVGRDRGSAYLFRRVGTGWTEVAKLTGNDVGNFSYFGTDVAVHGRTVIVGAPNCCGQLGAAYVFEPTSTGWVQAQKLQTTPPVPSGNLGRAVAITDDVALVQGEQGVYVFERGDSAWSQTAVLAPPSSFGFGESLAVEPDRAVIGDPYDADVGTDGGAVYVFERTDVGWVQTAKLLASDGSFYRHFGQAVALEGDRILATSTTRTYLFEKTGIGSNWVETWLVAPVQGGFGDEYGYEADLSGNTVAIGQLAGFGATPGSGAVESYVLLDSPVSYCTSTPNSTGAPATIATSGCGSLSMNDLVLSAAPVPDQVGVFIYGPVQAQVPFGDGFLCIGGQVTRFPPVAASSGQLTYAVDNTQLPGPPITAGTTWQFQGWFRDPAAGGAGFNFSDALSVPFSP